MREIKFRMWDKVEKIMAQVAYLNLTENPFVNTFGYGCRNMNEVELMQYTGLKDKNGKEIYEGDILPVYEQGEEFKYKVIYDGDCFMLSMLDTNQGSYPLSVKNRISTVLGNIYENPELLEV